MHDNLTHLVWLHSAWYTHIDLKNFFPTGEIFDPKGIWDETLSWSVNTDIPTQRREKIWKKALELDTEKIRKTLEEKDIQIISWYDALYPESLKTIRHAPFLLYVRGVLRSDMTMIGIVGSRKSTPYAKKILDRIIPDICKSQIGVISGGALGVDTLSHELTLDHHGYTISILGTGIDRAYPASNKSLFERIITSGSAVISHFPLGTWPEVYNFPIRNEIVVGLARGIVIPEAGLSSGTLITSQLALEHGRDVFAVPGDIDRATSEGTNMLIASGQAKCIRCSADILEEYCDVSGMGDGMTAIIREAPVFEDAMEQKIYEWILWWHLTVDDISKYTKYEMSDLLIHLSMLEINGHISMDVMGKYQIV